MVTGMEWRYAWSCGFFFFFFFFFQRGLSFFLSLCLLLTLSLRLGWFQDTKIPRGFEKSSCIIIKLACMVMVRVGFFTACVRIVYI